MNNPKTVNVLNTRTQKVVVLVSGKLMADPMRVTRLENHLKQAGISYEFHVAE